jgi:hypothetical protein
MNVPLDLCEQLQVVLRIIQKQLQADNLDVTLRCGTRPSHEESLPVAHGTIPGLEEGVQSGRVDEGQVMEIEDDRRDAVALEGGQAFRQCRSGCHVELAAQGDGGDTIFLLGPGSERRLQPMARPFLGDHQSGDGREIGALGWRTMRIGVRLHENTPPSSR